tara:strand:- start:22602 stop:23456 length:855 start_codon:yes stop_codon:yes gene_type:complete
VKPEKINEFTKIPFLPISAFKSHEMKCGSFKAEATFTSSGTGGQTSRHLVKNLNLYEKSFQLGFEHFYNEIEEYCVLGLLPSYLEREGSSLIYMVNDFIKKSSHPKSGFFLNNQVDLYIVLKELVKKNTKVLLIGVSFALLDFADRYQIEASENLIVMETGGMKGRRKELIREELHVTLCTSFGVKHIHSEYGMTELLSQAYSKGNGVFETPPWMKVLIREQDDPFKMVKPRQAGAINIIDLANSSSCAFLRTDDLGIDVSDSQFKVLGRLDVSDLRGCNLMVS